MALISIQKPSRYSSSYLSSERQGALLGSPLPLVEACLLEYKVIVLLVIGWVLALSAMKTIFLNNDKLITKE